ncbi:MAG: hypothetical protein A3H98_01515 [Bacteroidetes bacterium RIFCSPLOWO2_02_FULL_36_8]|nr:MAG: hypothetical protein A3H98_01515 [Bacteroidetes bacterium RIFCSPLOWO2_02_FULL_36_8]OFY71597.1 MAG: hypothetical protein A3G23_02615 [Bacteroidetes bacterium RIFCSPLOWO2_12_FULL_37_12]
MRESNPQIYTIYLMNEIFRPLNHVSPVGFINSIRFYSRIFFDFQVKTIYDSLKLFLRNKKGRILDLGCGDGPYEHLINKKGEYIGADINNSDKFNYMKKNILIINEYKIPLPDLSVDYIICTEVLEHIQEPLLSIKEMNRVLVNGGELFLTVPWSARYHYIPHDYFRYSPSMLRKLFYGFSDCKIIPRGTDLLVIISKIMVIYLRNLIPRKFLGTINSMLALCVTPLILLLVFIGYIVLYLNLGSDNDPLGYTVIAKK